MRFTRLEVYEYIDDTINDYALTHTFPNVDVTYGSFIKDGVVCGKLLMSIVVMDGVVVALLQTFDDDPIKIDETGIEITGTLTLPAPVGKADHGYWRLYAN